MKTKKNIFPRVSDWREVEIKQYNWTNDNPLLDLEIVFYEADAKYSYGSCNENFRSAYQKYEILDNKTGNRYKQELLGESAYYDIRRLANDFVSKQIIKELRALGKNEQKRF